MKRRDGQPTLIEYLAAELGLIQAARVASLAVSWAIARAALEERGQWPEGRLARVDAYGAYWRQSRAQTYRELALWRSVVPEPWADVDVYVDLVIERAGVVYAPDRVAFAAVPA